MYIKDIKGRCVSIIHHDCCAASLSKILQLTYIKLGISAQFYCFRLLIFCES